MRSVRSSFQNLVTRCALFLGVAACSAQAEETTIPLGSDWRYLDDGTDPGPTWATLSFDDSAWQIGPAELGYGDGDEATVVDYGPDSDNKYITTYFRHTFDVVDPATVRSIVIRVRRDDGIVLHVNGVPFYRNNMPSGSIDYLTQAEREIVGDEEDRFRYAFVPLSSLVVGNNVLAAEIHQVNPDSSDISFDLEAQTVFLDDPPQLWRGPYLQRIGEDQVTVRWLTDVPTDSVLEYGTTQGNLDQQIHLTASVSEHEVQVTGLPPESTFHYAVGDSTHGRFAGDDGLHWFATAPPRGSKRAFRAWAIGDSGTANSNAAAVRDAYLAHTGAQPTDLWLMLGDNAYPSGTEEEYQEAVFRMYPSLLRQSAVWPTLGNHDGLSADSDLQIGPYYELFTLPTQGEAGGLPSGTEAYYSFDHANVHFVCLDSFDSPRLIGDAMLNWLEADLASTDQDWVIAYWHHPPYTKGSHDSDKRDDSGGRMAEMREHALVILEDAGVDLVLGGHSHSYERSMLIDGHYGDSSTFAPEHQIDTGDGREDGDGAYRKGSQSLEPHEGAVYIVAGSSGKAGNGSLDHPVMVTSLSKLGSVVLDFEGNRLDVSFLRENGNLDDWFTIVKGPDDPEADRTAFTTTFTDGTLGGLRAYSGKVQVRADGLEIESDARLALPAAPRDRPQFAMTISGGMPDRAAVGLDIALRSAPDAVQRGVHSLRVELLHRRGGEVVVQLFEDGQRIARGPGLLVRADRDPVLFRGDVSADRVRVWVGERLALDHALRTRRFADTLALYARLPSSGLLRLEHLTVHESARVPGVHFDDEGRLWLELFVHNLESRFRNGEFLLAIDDEVYTWSQFTRDVLPGFDQVEAAHAHHLLVGRSDPLPAGTLVELVYSEHRDADVQLR